MSNERNLVMVRIADPEKEPVREWCQANSDRNSFNEQVLSYPVMKVLASHSNGTTFTYMPIQAVAMLESIGINPEAQPLEVATGVMESVKSAVVLAQSAGYKELYFLESDGVTSEGARRMGFEQVGRNVTQLNEETGEPEEVFVPFQVFRKKI